MFVGYESKVVGIDVLIGEILNYFICVCGIYMYDIML